MLADLESLGLSVRRIGGADRYAIAAAVSAAAFSGGADTVVIATGSAFPDALAGGAFGAAFGAPLLLVPSGTNAVPPAVRDELVRLAPAHIVVLGGTAAVSAGMAEAVTSLTGASVVRYAGGDRYETAARLAAGEFPAADVAYLATGADFPDALALGPSAAVLHGPLLLTPPTSLSGHTATQLARLDPLFVLAAGGPAALSDVVIADVEALLD